MSLKILEPDAPYDFDLLTKMLDRTKSRVFLGRNAAFLGSLMCSLEFVWSIEIETAGTDGEKFYWNPKDFLSLDEEGRKATVEHELWHVARLHIVRKGSRDMDDWNIACDVRINRDLRSEGYTLNPPHLWIANHPEIPHEVEEDIYDWIKKQRQQGGGAGLPGAGGGTNAGHHMIPGSAANKQKIINAVVKAVHQTKLANQAGSIPGDIIKTLKKFLDPVVPWEVVLYQFFSDLMDDDYSWKRPNRRYDPDTLYLPSRFMDEGRLEHLVYYLDVSGSITDKDLIRFNSEVKYIKDTFNPQKLTLVQFDTRISDEQIITENDQFDEVKIKGGGGTCLIPVREHILETKPTAAIIFSDLCVTPMEPIPDKFPVIWVAVRNKEATVPFGKLIHIKG